MNKLDDGAIATELRATPHWRRRGDAIERTWKFASFAAAVAFVNSVAAVAEELDHHPDITIRYDTVTLVLSTHDARGLTARDFTLARRLDAAR